MLHVCISAQDSLTYRVDAFSSLANKDNSPFWIANNTYGVVPLKSRSAHARTNFFWEKHINKGLRINFGLDIEGAINHSAPLFIQQMYSAISYKLFYLCIGSKEYYNSMLNRNLSSGDFSFSTNARPIPEINLSIPKFTPIPFTRSTVLFRGDFAVGKSTDSNYHERTRAPKEEYAKDILWHHKSLFFLLQDPSQNFPLYLIFGGVHAAQWGGWSSNSNLEKLPNSLDDFIRIVMGRGGGENSSLGEQINTLGNHQGTYNLKIGYNCQHFNVNVYKQHYFDDKSGMEFSNWRDGIWGTEFIFNKKKYLNKIVFEFINTTNQSGPMHFLTYDRPARGGGDDNYYNHTQYVNGWSHWGRSLGNPLIVSPEYNNDGTLYFKNNRIKGFHAGLEGEISPLLSYRILATETFSWGRMQYPFLVKKNSLSTLFECNYSPPKLKDWKISFQTAFDVGSLHGDNIGFSIKISKYGSINLKQ